MISLDKEKIIEAIKEILHNNQEILFAYLFGSFIESDIYNDIDIAIFIDESSLNSISRWFEIDLSLEVEKLICKKTDIILLNKAPDHLIHQVSRGQILIDRDEEKRFDFILPAWKRYFDFQIKRHEYLQQIL